MAGTIIADTLTHSTAGSVTTDYVVNGSAKAWAVTDLTGTLSDSLNVSSADDDGTADFGLNFTNSFGSAAYVANITPNVTALNPRLYLVSPSRATSACEFRGMESTSGTQLESNVTDTMASIQGDLA